jgi:ribosomal protein RSM22 (predicted rRNA methylase)
VPETLATHKTAWSMATFPGNLDEAVAAWLAGRGQKLASRSSALSERYRAGVTSSHVDPAAYLAARAPATFAACRKVLAEVQRAAPEFKPASLLDVGAGPGTAGWAAVTHWPSLARITQVEEASVFADLAAGLNVASGLAALENARLVRTSLQDMDGAEEADIVLAAYVLAELPLASILATVTSLWKRALQALVFVEPGTPQGFSRMRAAREALIAAGAHIAAPCTHDGACPMTGDDWCHFKVRLPRSRLHMHAKSATVPFEDEAFSYVVALCDSAPSEACRILEPPVTNKTGITMKLCGASGLEQRHIASRDKAAFKAAKKLQWGDLL